MFTRHTLPIHEPFLPGLARLLLDVSGDRLPRALVLLPSTRACESLRHTLLETSGSDGLLLPRIMTPGSLIDDLEVRLDNIAPVDVPGDLRAAVLAPRLSTLDWLRDQPGAAAGMAEQMVRLFDELRRHELDPGDLDDGGPAAAERPRRDVARVGESWQLYRSVVPRDDLDRERDIIDALVAVDPWPGVPSSRRPFDPGRRHGGRNGPSAFTGTRRRFPDPTLPGVIQRPGRPHASLVAQSAHGVVPAGGVARDTRPRF